MCGADRARDPPRGPIDQHRIDEWVAAARATFGGRVFEIGFDMLRGSSAAIASSRDVLSILPGRAVTIVDDLTRPSHLLDRSFDCIILTQTLPFIYDVPAALRTLHAILAPGGTLLATFPGISQICRCEMEHFGDYWRFTTATARRLFEDHFAPADVQVKAAGNVLAAIAFLMGMSSEELTPEELGFADPDYELLVTVKRRSPEPLLSGLDGSAPVSVVVLSPHSDDAAFSLAATLDALVQRGSRVTIVTCFSRSTFTRAAAPLRVERVTALRKDEDVRYAATLGANCTTEWLDEPDAPLRGVAVSALCSMRSLSEEHRQLAERIAARVAAQWAACDVLFAPLGIGGHIDHRIVHEAVLRTREGVSHARGLLRRHAVRRARVARAHRAQLADEAACRLAGRGEPFVLASPRVIDRKRAASACYPSQISPDVVRTTLAGHCGQRSRCSMERVWQIVDEAHT